MTKKIDPPDETTLTPTGYDVYRFPTGQRVKGFLDKDNRYYEKIDFGFGQEEWYIEEDDFVFGATEMVLAPLGLGR